MARAPVRALAAETQVAKRRAFPLRIAPELYEALQKWAGDEFRSLNGQIEYLLREALKKAGRAPRRRRDDGNAPTDD